MLPALAWLEGSPLGRLMRETGVWTYAVVNLCHILGLATLFGAVLLLDLRLLGRWRHIPLGSIAGPASRVAAFGCAVAFVTGLALLATKATEYAGNLFLWGVKFPAIALALVNAWFARRTIAAIPSHPENGSLHPNPALFRHGLVSLVCWLATLAGGRLAAYW